MLLTVMLVFFIFLTGSQGKPTETDKGSLDTKGTGSITSNGVPTLTTETENNKGTSGTENGPSIAPSPLDMGAENKQSSSGGENSTSIGISPRSMGMNNYRSTLDPVTGTNPWANICQDKVEHPFQTGRNCTSSVPAYNQPGYGGGSLNGRIGAPASNSGCRNTCGRPNCQASCGKNNDGSDDNNILIQLVNQQTIPNTNGQNFQNQHQGNSGMVQPSSAIEMGEEGGAAGNGGAGQLQSSSGVRGVEGQGLVSAHGSASGSHSSASGFAIHKEVSVSTGPCKHKCVPSCPDYRIYAGSCAGGKVCCFNY